MVLACGPNLLDPALLRLHRGPSSTTYIIHLSLLVMNVPIMFVNDVSFPLAVDGTHTCTMPICMAYRPSHTSASLPHFSLCPAISLHYGFVPSSVLCPLYPCSTIHSHSICDTDPMDCPVSLPLLPSLCLIAIHALRFARQYEVEHWYEPRA